MSRWARDRDSKMKQEAPGPETQDADPSPAASKLWGSGHVVPAPEVLLVLKPRRTEPAEWAGRRQRGDARTGRHSAGTSAFLLSPPPHQPPPTIHLGRSQLMEL